MHEQKNSLRASPICYLAEKAIRLDPIIGLSYKERNKIARFFNKLKHGREIATRYCKLAASFLSAIKWAACINILNN